MAKGAVVIARADHMSLTHGPATNRASQQVVRQVIRTIKDHSIKQFKHVAGSKNAGPDGASRLPIEGDALW